MTKELCHTSMWSNKNVVAEYANTFSAQLPETLIYIKHREEIINQDLLDLGCGAGRTSYILNRLTTSYCGIDYSKEMITLCKQRFSQGSFECADARDLSKFAASRFDFILFSFNGLDCMNHEQRIITMREIHRVLKPNKLFVFSSHNRNYANAEMTPGLQRCLNPFTQLRYLGNYFLSMRNYQKNSVYEVKTEEYALLRSQDYCFKHLYYFIEKNKQVEQAARLGFKIIETYDITGALLNERDDDSSSCWIYYVARKI